LKLILHVGPKLRQRSQLSQLSNRLQIRK